MTAKMKRREEKGEEGCVSGDGRGGVSMPGSQAVRLSQTSSSQTGEGGAEGD